MKSLNSRILWCWMLYCIVGCGLLSDIAMGARYLPTRRSIPTQLERNERLRELYQHILETERDAHLSAANQYSDKLKLIQKKSDFGLTPDPIKDYNDEFADDYDERTQFDGQKSHLQRQKPWRFVLMNYGHAANRNHKNEQAIGNAKMHSLSGSVDELMNAPRSQQKIYRPKPAKSSATNADASDSTNDLDWITSNTELSSANDYDALYDDVNEKRSSSSNLKFDHYRRNGPLAQRKEHLN